MVTGPFIDCVERLADPRMVNKCAYHLLDISVIAVCATVATANSWDEIALFGQQKVA